MRDKEAAALRQYKRNASAIARDFNYEYYVPGILNRIWNAQNEVQIDNLMIMGRRSLPD